MGAETGRARWHRIAMIAMFVLMSLAVMASPARAAPSQAEALRAEFDAWSKDVSGLLSDMSGFRDTLLPRYECPPAEPNKESKYAELNSFSSRMANLRRTGASINDRRILLGTAGEGQVGSGIRDRIRQRLLGPDSAGKALITDAEIRQVDAILTRLTQALGELRRDLSDIPATQRDCDPRFDPIRAIVFNAPEQEPGTNVNALVSATTASGKPVIISAVSVDGIDEIGAAGVIGGLGTANPTYGFDIAAVRRQGPFTLRVTVTGLPAGFPAGATPLSHTVSVNYTVRNVAPVIERLPDAPKAKPGEAMKLEGRVVVVDRNADARNAQELIPVRVTLGGHPAGLDTMPDQAFQRFSVTRLISHDPSTGRYIFEVGRTATTRKPHPHGVFPAKIAVADRRGLSADSDITLTVENVAPTLTMRVGPPRNFHSGDGKLVEIVGAVADDNGADDIADIVIDARQAGGAEYRLSGGGIVRNPGASPDGFSFRINPASFPHTNNGGEWPIRATASDGGAPEQGLAAPLTANAASSITVANLEPEMTAYGFISNLGLAPGKKNVCPREAIFVGVTVRDPEGDALRVQAVIKETGATTDLAIDPGNKTYTGYVQAPDAPGTYTIEFVATEVGTNTPHTVRRTIELIVVPCGAEQASQAAVAEDQLVVQAPPGSEVKIGPEAPPLPGELPANLADIFAYSRMLHWAGKIDALDALIGDDAATDGIPPMSLFVIGAFMDQFLNRRPFKLLEDGGVHADGTCGIGTGEGPVFEIGDPPAGNPPDDPALDAFEELARRFAERAAELDKEPDYSGVDLELDLDFGEDADLKQEYGEWIDREFGPAASPAPDRTAEKARLQKEYDELAERQRRLNRAGETIREAIKNTRDAAEKARLQGQLADIESYQQAIHDQAVPLGEQLNAFDQAARDARADLRIRLSNEINASAAQSIANVIGLEGSLQDAKDTATWGTRWISTGSAMQYETRKTTRTADRELAAADMKLAVIEVKMKYAAPGSDEMAILEEFKARYERQKAAAEQLLSSNAALTAAGYGVDVVLTLTAAKMVQVGKNIIVGAAGRTLAPQTAQRVIAATTERGLTDLAKSAVGRGTASQAGTSAATSAASRSGSKLADEAADAAQSAMNASRTESVTEALVARPGQKGADIVLVGRGGRVTRLRADVADVLREMAEETGNEGLRKGAALVEQTAYKLGISQQRALQRILDDVIGPDILPGPNTAEARAVLEALEAAGQRGRDAFQTMQQAAAEAAAARQTAAADRAREILQQRYGADQGRNVLDAARQQVKGWGESINLGSSTFYTAVPLFIGLLAQEGYAAEAPQATADRSGQARVAGDFGLGIALDYEYRVERGGPAYGTYGDDRTLVAKGRWGTIDFGQIGPDRLRYGAGLSYDPFPSNNDNCRVKKIVPDEAGERP